MSSSSTSASTSALSPQRRNSLLSSFGTAPANNATAKKPPQKLQQQQQSPPQRHGSRGYQAPRRYVDPKLQKKREYSRMQDYLNSLMDELQRVSREIAVTRRSIENIENELYADEDEEQEFDGY